MMDGVVDPQEGSAMRRPPHSVEAEKALLGACLVNSKSYDTVAGYLAPEHFAIEAHQILFAAIKGMIDTGKVADVVTLARTMEQDDRLAEIGGAPYLNDLAASAVGIINAGEYGRVIHDLHLKRELIAIGQGVIERAYGAGIEDNGAMLIEAIDGDLRALTEKGPEDDRSRPHAVDAVLGQYQWQEDNPGRLAGLATGLIDLDHRLNGMAPSDLIILGGRPSMGKTALALTIAQHVAAMPEGVAEDADHGPVLFFELEMSEQQVTERLLADMADVDLSKILRADLDVVDKRALWAAGARLKGLPLIFDDRTALTVNQMVAKAKKTQDKRGLKLIVVDHLTLMGSVTRHVNNRVQEVSEISLGLKRMAKDLNVPVLALCQLSRAVEQRENKRPQLSDLRESGTIEQDGDVVMFVYRDEYYLRRNKPQRREIEKQETFDARMGAWMADIDAVEHKAELDVVKQRQGPIGRVDLYFDGARQRFSNAAREPYGEREPS